MNIYTSNSIAGSGNQYIFASDGAAHTGRAFYRITHGGSFHYSLLFTNTIDSTFADGSVSRCNDVCPAWTIHSIKIGRCRIIDGEIAFLCATFDGQTQKAVSAGEECRTDPVEMTFDAGDYLCLEMTFSGTRLPYHEESLLPIFRLDAGKWVSDKRMPLPAMIGCDRPVKKRVAFLGDSITQGIGTEVNSYEHWCARLTQMLPENWACWNLGLGYGRANDLASNGVWLQKARDNDIVFLCCGVNDLLQGFSQSQILNDIQSIVDLLKREGIFVILQAIPPFDYTGETILIWQRLNRALLSINADLLFNNVPILGHPNAPHIARYGGHPNAEGCRVWADALYDFLTGSDLL